MLLVLFNIGVERFAISSHIVVEILPFLRLQEASPRCEEISGLINYRGRPLPVLDLRVHLADSPCRQSLSSRIIVINYLDERASGRRERRLGLLAEKVTETVVVADELLEACLQRAAGELKVKHYLDADLVGRELVQWFDPRAEIMAILGDRLDLLP
ncbi:chemotaxis protein CheW [Desulfobacterota bacterium M19]